MEAGEGAVDVSVASAPDGFNMNPASLTVEEGASQEVEVVFTPIEARAYSGSLTLAYEGLQASIEVTGEGEIVTSLDNDRIKEEDINLFPNPASEYLTIDLSALPSRPLDIQIINPLGNEVLSRQGYESRQLTLNVADYKSGMYLAIITDGKSIARKKIMIKK